MRIDEEVDDRAALMGTLELVVMRLKISAWFSRTNEAMEATILTKEEFDALPVNAQMAIKETVGAIKSASDLLKEFGDMLTEMISSAKEMMDLVKASEEVVNEAEEIIEDPRKP